VKAMNVGLEETFYVPLTHHRDFWNAVSKAGLDVFRIRTCGIPSAYPKNSGHWQIEAEVKCKELGLEPRKNLLEEYYKGDDK